jgi:hypothetical protein
MSRQVARICQDLDVTDSWDTSASLSINSFEDEHAAGLQADFERLLGGLSIHGERRSSPHVGDALVSRVGMTGILARGKFHDELALPAAYTRASQDARLP